MDFNELLDLVKNKGVTGIVSDSKKVIPGSVFVCIKGYKADGHDYAFDALANGANYIVAEKDLGINNQIIVPASRTALAHLSHTFYDNPSQKLQLIGVTGTNGKTSSVFMLHHILKDEGAGLFSTVKTVVGLKTVPQERTTPDVLELDELLLKMLKAGSEYAIMEVSSHSVVLERVSGLHFKGGIFTNLTQDHLDFHKNMAEYAKAKKDFFMMMDQESVAAFNLDDSYADYMLDGFKGKIVSFGVNRGLIRANDIKATATEITYTLAIEKNTWPVNLPIGGEFNVYNSLGVLALLYGLGFNLELAVSRLKSFSGVPGRFQKVDLGQEFAVIVDYAHTPDGLKNLLFSAKNQCQGKLTVVFGCGGDRDKTKRPKMAAEAEKWADKIIVTSDNPRSEDPQAIINDILAGFKSTRYRVEPDRQKAIFQAIIDAQKGDLIVIAGKGHEDYQEIKGIKYHFDDTQVAREGLLKFAKNQCQKA